MKPILTNLNPLTRALAWSLAAGLAVLPGCFGSGQSSSGNLPGTGKAKLFLERVEWGRLVDVFDLDGVLAERDVVVREGLADDDVNYVFDLNPVTGAESLTILAQVGSALFDTLLTQATTGRAAITTKGLTDPPTFSRLARNGALRLEFSEFVDPAAVNRGTIQLLVGDPPVFNQDVRYIVKETIGSDGSPKGVVICDPTISRFDTATLGIPENNVGYPQSFDQILPNLLLRIPTVVDPVFGVTQVLTNLDGNRTLGVLSSDPTELSAGLDPIVVRAMRTGGSLDPFNGFMVDFLRPKLVTELPITISNVVENGSLRTVTYSIDTSNCASVTPKEGDIIEVGISTVLVVSNVDSSGDPNSLIVTAGLLSGDLAGGGASVPGILTTAYRQDDQQLQVCWLQFSPEPTNPPNDGVDPYATVSVRFNEPIDSTTVRSLETFVFNSYEIDPNPGGNDPTRQFRGVVNGGSSNESVGEYIDRQIGYDQLGNGGRVFFGPVEVSADSTTFTLAPAAGISDPNEDGLLNLSVALRDGSSGILDLAGNPLAATDFVAGNIDQALLIELAGDPAFWPTDRYFALRMNSLDEDNDGLSEYKGQFNFGDGVLRPRDLLRFSRSADSANQYVGQRIQFGQGIQTPLTPAGAVLMTVWRYIDLNFGLQAPSEYNLDVEGMNWSPFAESVVDDTFDRYSIALSHSHKSPEEFISPSSGYPESPGSGLIRDQPFDNNILGFPEYDEQIVFDVPSYQISQVNLFTSTSGSAMYPWPDFTSTYTWRDTSIPQTEKGGSGSQGVPPRVVNAPSVVYPRLDIPSIGLPLQGRFRCYPRGEFFRDNGFQVQIMVASSALPAFRVFSAGGRDGGGTWHLVIPDDPSSGGVRPTGGYRPNGGTTKNHGPELYWHQFDFVLRLSRVTTHWFSLGGQPESISAVSVEPSAESQAPGTQVLVEFRGTEDFDDSACGDSDPSPLTDASTPFDDYGDFIGDCGIVNNPSDWTTNINSLVTNGYTHFQIRITFVSNIVQNLTPELDAFGFAWNVK